MTRRVLFSFDYEQLDRVNQVREVPGVEAVAAAGFDSASAWDEAEKQGVPVIERLIDESLEDTTVTVICITQGTGASELVNQQIDRSLARGNGLVAVRIHRVKDADGNATELGASPPQIENSGYQTYDYRKPASLAKWIEAAAKRAGH